MRKHRSLPALISLLCVCVLLTALCGAYVYAAGGESPGNTLEISVVEQIPAEELDDNEVPLASPFPGGPERSVFRTAAPAGVMLLVSLLYVAFTVRREKRLAALRMEAAHAEERYMRERREARS
jgi:hypothetical protein